MTLYHDVGGFDTIAVICHRWHELCLDDPIAAHPFSHGTHPHHTERLAGYLAETWGGPRLYTAGYGDESFVQRIHAGNQMSGEFLELLTTLFDRAIHESVEDPTVAQRAEQAWRDAVESMAPYDSGQTPVPDGLEMPDLS